MGETLKNKRREKVKGERPIVISWKWRFCPLSDREQITKVDDPERKYHIDNCHRKGTIIPGMQSVRVGRVSTCLEKFCVGCCIFSHFEVFLTLSINYVMITPLTTSHLWIYRDNLEDITFITIYLWNRTVKNTLCSPTPPAIIPDNFQLHFQQEASLFVVILCYI